MYTVSVYSDIIFSGMCVGIPLTHYVNFFVVLIISKISYFLNADMRFLLFLFLWVNVWRWFVCFKMECIYKNKYWWTAIYSALIFLKLLMNNNLLYCLYYTYTVIDLFLVLGNKALWSSIRRSWKCFLKTNKDRIESWLSLIDKILL